MQAVQPLEAIQVRRVPISPDLLNPGDYVFIPKKKPLITEERVAINSPTFFQRMFRKTYEIKETVIRLWPEIDTVIINCPDCNSPIATTSTHKIISIEPLTIEIPITCPYCKTKSFTITAGKLTPILNG
jgi:hypothetical protein